MNVPVRIIIENKIATTIQMRKRDREREKEKENEKDRKRGKDRDWFSEWSISINV